jgi:putative NIF3 family GTP cyclohydrolase 1 type 2
VIEIYDVGHERRIGEGRVGRLASALSPTEASRKIASVLGSQPVCVSGNVKARDVLVWDGDPEAGLYEALLRGIDLYVGPDSHGLAKIIANTREAGIVEFPHYCFLMTGAKELIYMVREKSKREAWGLRTFLPSKAGKEGVHT